MAALFGLDCPNPECRHKTALSYRLRMLVRRGVTCLICWHAGAKHPPVFNGGTNEYEHDWVRCERCSRNWQTKWENERNDLVFKPAFKESAFAQMALLGVEEPNIGQHLVEKHRTLPPGHDGRLVILTEEALPKTAVYFRWRPDLGEMLSPDKIFQCVFGVDATPAERRYAPEIRLTEDQCRALIRHNSAKEATFAVETFTTIRCQHCYKPLPAAALSTASLRETEKGE